MAKEIVRTIAGMQQTHFCVRRFWDWLRFHLGWRPKMCGWSHQDELWTWEENTYELSHSDSIESECHDVHQEQGCGWLNGVSYQWKQAACDRVNWQRLPGMIYLLIRSDCGLDHQCLANSMLRQLTFPKPNLSVNGTSNSAPIMNP